MENLAYLIIKVSRHLKNSLDNKLKEYDVTAAQFSVLNQIYNKNGSITLVEVASKLSSDKPTISAIIDRLVSKGLLERVDNPNDRRSAYLKMSREALDLVVNLRLISDQLTTLIFDDFESEEIAALENYLLRIAKKTEML
ncbi:MAG: hypothetical protein K0R93_2734 [Anaerosolibacter sp.]|jgi:DNA-binding MarR family transcriptional regulator|uniref:MarR family winged helix-turn-helix transcriptional regulator n=1 Tax=Anaerosolibacter sp. TaxID=1872527 RepID=UPI0026060C04|nr:MarR family transcriptional regulator [Anaerosolibacter sp.]MDF2547836.1 hypothetical protein [Anaerosolibacter sp.]